MSNHEMKNESGTTSNHSTTNPNGPSDRRSFIKHTAMLAGAATAGLAATSVSAAAPDPRHPVVARAPVAVAQVRFSRKSPPTLEELQQAILEICKECGCVTCGLNGFDLHLALDEVIKLDRFNGSAFIEGTING